jgi:protein-L-isoaspartate(D-aspartate) O-methyltransferase
MVGMIDFATARRTMVESQLRPTKVTDPRLLAAMGELPRELFLPPSRQPLAYMDAAVEVWPATDGALPRYLLAPVVLARLIQLASVEAADSVLDIGCATGYSTAVLSRLASSVTAVEVEPELVAAASANLAALGIGNATVVEGALTEGAPDAAPFDVIFINGSIVDVPTGLPAQLKDGGRLVAIVAGGEGRPGQPKASLFVTVEGETSGVFHFDANAKPLPGFAQAVCFTL